MTNKLNITFAYYAMFVLLGILMASTGPLLPSLAEQTSSKIAEISILFSAVSLGRLFGALFGGRLLDAFSGHRLIVMTLVLLALTASVIPFASLLFVLLAFYLVFGLLQSITDVGTNTLIIWLHRDKVAPFMNALHLSFGVGAFLAPILIARVVLLTGGIAWVYWLFAVFTLPLIIWFSKLASPKAASDDDMPQETVRDTPLVIMLVCFFTFYVSTEAGFAGWIYTYALESGLENATNAAYLTSAFFATYTLGRLIAIPLATRLKPKVVLLSDMIAAVCCLAAMLLFPASRLVIWLGTLGLGLSLASAFPTALAFAERRMSVTGKITSYFFLGGSLGGIVTPWLMGRFFDSVGPEVIFLILCVVAVAALLMLLLISRYTSTKL